MGAQGFSYDYGKDFIVRILGGLKTDRGRGRGGGGVWGLRFL